MTLVEHEQMASWPDDESVSAALSVALSFLPQTLQSLTQSLAVAVSPKPDQLLHAHNSALAESSQATHEDLDQLLKCPLVEVADGRVRLLRPLDTDLAKKLRDNDPVRFERLHTTFAQLESDQASTPLSDLDTWQTTARLAYYLAPNAPRDSSRTYIKSFDQAPHSSRTACRSWLADLAEKFATISDEDSRVSDFFRAFRLFASGDKASARPLLQRLLDPPLEDEIEAIGTHLLALSTHKRDSIKRHQLLKRSVELSEKLELFDNLIMSRQSLVWDNVTLTRNRNPLGTLKRAADLAVTNDLLADQLDVSFYQTWTRNARAVTLWLAATGVGRVPTSAAQLPEFKQAIRLLNESRQHAEAATDLYSWIVASISEASMCRSVGEYDDAAATLEDAVRAAERARATGELPVRQFDAEINRLISAHGQSPDTAKLKSLTRRLRKLEWGLR